MKPEELELLRRAKSGDKAAESALVKKCEWLCIYWANKLKTGPEDFEDLKQEAMLGAFHAIRRADLSKIESQKSFSTWATYSIRSAVYRYAQKRTLLTFKNPHAIQKLFSKKFSRLQKLADRCGISLDNETISKYMKVDAATIEQSKQMWNLGHTPLSLDEIVPAERSTKLTLNEIISDRHLKDLYGESEYAELHPRFGDLIEAVKSLPERLKQVIVLSHLVAVPLNQKRLAEAMGISVSRVAQLKAQAIHILQEKLSAGVQSD